MTVILTLVGIIVMFISFFTTKSFKTSFLRLLICAGTGLVLDVVLGVALAIATYPML